MFAPFNPSLNFEFLVKLEDGAQHKNLRIFSVSTGDELASFSQKGIEGWELQYTISESHAVRIVGQEIQVFQPAEWSKGVVDKLKVEGVKSISLSPGLNPSLAVFLAEKNVRCQQFFLIDLLIYFYTRANRPISGSTVCYHWQALQLAKSQHSVLNTPNSNGTRSVRKYLRS